MRFCLKNPMKFAGQYGESQRRRDAAGVPLEPRLGRVDELPSCEVAGDSAPPEQARTATVTEEKSLRKHRFTSDTCG